MYAYEVTVKKWSCISHHRCDIGDAIIDARSHPDVSELYIRRYVYIDTYTYIQGFLGGPEGKVLGFVQNIYLRITVSTNVDYTVRDALMLDLKRLFILHFEQAEIAISLT